MVSRGQRKPALNPDKKSPARPTHDPDLLKVGAVLQALNPGLPADAYAKAIEQLATDRSKQIAVNANRDVYRLLKDGVKVKVPDEHGGLASAERGRRPGEEGPGHRAAPPADAERAARREVQG